MAQHMVADPYAPGTSVLATGHYRDPAGAANFSPYSAHGGQYTTGPYWGQPSHPQPYMYAQEQRKPKQSFYGAANADESCLGTYSNPFVFYQYKKMFYHKPPHFESCPGHDPKHFKRKGPIHGKKHWNFSEPCPGPGHDHVSGSDKFQLPDAMMLPCTGPVRYSWVGHVPTNNANNGVSVNSQYVIKPELFGQLIHAQQIKNGVEVTRFPHDEDIQNKDWRQIGSLMYSKDEELRPGCAVIIQGMTGGIGEDKELNGRLGHLDEFDHQSGRWPVLLKDGSRVFMLPKNLRFQAPEHMAGFAMSITEYPGLAPAYDMRSLEPKRQDTDGFKKYEGMNALRQERALFPERRAQANQGQTELFDDEALAEFFSDPMGAIDRGVSMT